MAKYYRRADNSFAGTWVDGVPDDPTLVETPTAPADGTMIWDGGSQTWGYKLSDARKGKIKEVKDRYNAELNGGMTYLAKSLDIDTQSQQDIIAATDTAREKKAAGSGWDPAFAWRMSDDTFLTLATPDDMIALCQAMKAEVYRLKQNRWLHTDNIRALTTVADIDAYDITTGW